MHTRRGKKSYIRTLIYLLQRLDLNLLAGSAN